MILETSNYIKLVNVSPLSVGFSHVGYIAVNFVYLWGRNDVNCAMKRVFFKVVSWKMKNDEK
jgi:hypothetical protein